MARKNEFREEDKIRTLLWCARHCCLCGKLAGLGIEVAHLDPVKSDIDNAIPLCFDCHAAIGHYNTKHPRGRKYSIPELRARRDQIYDEHTRHLVPVLTYRVHQHGRKLPMVGFSLTHVGNTPSVKALVRLDTYINGSPTDNPAEYGLYRGKFRWNLNPGEGVDGQFTIPQLSTSAGEDVRVGVNITVYDVYDRPHEFLPVTYVLMADRERWFLDPIDPKESAAQVQRKVQDEGKPA